nr:uncharacterized protein LOC109178688 [Ipomoea trifida]
MEENSSSIMSSSLSNTRRRYGFRDFTEIRLCECGNELVIKTSWTDRNPDRRFWKCSESLKELLVQICSPQPSSPREAADWRWSRGGSSGSDETSSGSPVRFLSSPHPFGETVVWRFLPARFRSGCVVIGSAQAIQISSSEVSIFYTLLATAQD